MLDAVENVADAEDSFFVIICANEKGYLDKVSSERTRAVFCVVEDDGVINGRYERRR